MCWKPTKHFQSCVIAGASNVMLFNFLLLPSTSGVHTHDGRQVSTFDAVVGGSLFGGAVGASLST